MEFNSPFQKQRKPINQIILLASKDTKQDSKIPNMLVSLVFPTHNFMLYDIYLGSVLLKSWIGPLCQRLYFAQIADAARDTSHLAQETIKSSLNVSHVTVILEIDL